MRISVLTIFPEIVAAYRAESIMRRAISRDLLSLELVNIRDFARDKHRSCDDAPYGGGSGMVFMPEPLSAAIEHVRRPESHVVYPSPSGKPFRQEDARRLAGKEHLVVIAGRYEGIDQRIIDEYVDEELCIGDYVLSSGEVAALAIIDATYRLREGVISGGSLEEESFEDGLLEYPHYTRPETFRGRTVPDVLLSGHHERIRAWRRQQRVLKTARLRPDLLAHTTLNDEDRSLLASADELTGDGNEDD